MPLASFGGSAGGNVFGYRPQPIAAPNPRANLSAATPLYGDITALLSQNILNNLSGSLSPAYQKAVTDSLNARSVGAGVGGTDFGNNAIALGLGREVQARQDLGAQQALSYFPVQSRTATLDPALMAEIERFNSLQAALPDPTARANYELNLYNQARREALSPTGLPGTRMTPGISYSGLSGSSYAPSRPFTPLVNWSQLPLISAPAVSSGAGGMSELFQNPYTPPQTYNPPSVVGSYNSSDIPSPQNSPDNWYDLTPQQQQSYVDEVLANSYINPEDYQ